MAKAIFTLSWALLAIVAPWSVSADYTIRGRSSNYVDTDKIVDKVMSSLDLKGAIANIMRSLSGSGTSFTGTFTSQPQPQTAGRFSKTQLGDDRISSFPVIVSQKENSFNLKSNSNSGVNKQEVVRKVLTLLNPQIEKSVAEALRALGRSSSKFSQTSSSIESSGFSVQKQDEVSLVSRIISILTPTITQSVKSALSGKTMTMNQQSIMNSMSKQSFGSSVNKQALVQKVLKTLAPTISAQVKAAIASMQSASQLSQSSQTVTISQQETNRLVKQIIRTLTPSITAAVREALRSRSTSFSGTTSSIGTTSFGFDSQSLVRKVMSALQPRIISLVSDAIATQEVIAAQAAAAKEQQRQKALIEAQRQAALLEQQRQAALREQQRQAALFEQQQAALIEQQRQEALFEQQRQQALLIQQQTSSVGQSNLASLFGSGHEVVHEVPGQKRVEYNIGMPGAFN